MCIWKIQLPGNYNTYSLTRTIFNKNFGEFLSTCTLESTMFQKEIDILTSFGRFQRRNRIARTFWSVTEWLGSHSKWLLFSSVALIIKLQGRKSRKECVLNASSAENGRTIKCILNHIKVIFFITVVFNWAFYVYCDTRFYGPGGWLFSNRIVRPSVFKSVWPSPFWPERNSRS